MNRWAKSMLIAGLLAGSMKAQLTRGFISGAVEDPAGAMITGVSITVTNSVTSLKRETETNEAGVYRLAAMEPGIYEIEYKKAGFETLHLSAVEISGAQEVVLNQKLSIAAAVTGIDVTASATGAELAKANATIQVNLPRRLLEELPTGENPAQLAQLAPGVIRLGRGSSTDAANPSSSNGQRPQMNDYTVDGVQNKDTVFFIPTNNVPREVVAEVSVQTQSYSAEFGRSAGAQVSTVTRGGSNQLHGMLFSYYDSDRLQPLSLLDKRAALPPGAYTTWRPGGNLGGPVRRNRTFFFVHTDVFRSVNDPSARNQPQPVTIPTEEGFAALPRVPLASGQSAASRQTMLDTIAFLPEIYRTGLALENIRTQSIDGVAIPVGTARIPVGHTDLTRNFVGRIDHQLTARDLLTYRMLWSGGSTDHSLLTNVAFGARFSAELDTAGPNHALTHTHIFSPALVNEFRFGASGGSIQTPGDDFGPLTSVTGAMTIGKATAVTVNRASYTYSFQDIATWQLRRHALKAGAEVRWNTWDSPALTVTNWTFRNFQDFLNNQAATVNWQTQRDALAYGWPNQFYFLQDDWKIRPNLTLALGVRYEYTGLPHGLFGAASPELLAAGIPGPVPADRNNWAPRASVAWSPSERTVLRAGYGIGYDMQIQPRSAAGNYPLAIAYDAFAPATYNLYPTLPPAPAGGRFDPLASFTNFDPSLQSPTTHFYSFSVQRQLGSKWVGEAGYAGNRSYHAYRQTQRNYALLTADQAERVRSTRNPDTGIPSPQLRRLHPQWGPRAVIESTGIANYNSAYFRVDRKFSRNFLLGAHYTYSAALSDINGPVVNLDSVPPQNAADNLAEYGRSEYDRPHRAVVYYLYETPSLHGAPAALGRVFGSWRIAGSSEWQSGQPFTITTGVDSNGDTVSGDRPDLNRAGVIKPDPVAGNLRTFTTALDGTGIVVTPLTAARLPLANSVVGGGNLGRSTFRGPGLTVWNVSLAKVVPLTERWRIDLRAETTNLFNHRNFGIPVTVMNSAQFGRNQADPGRRTVVLSAHVRF